MAPAHTVEPGEPAVLTVGSVQAGTKSNVIPDHATILLNLRTYNEGTRSSVLDAIKRIVTAECTASRSPQPPEFELFDQFPSTDNDPAVTERVAAAFAGYFGDGARQLPRPRHPLHLLGHRRNRPALYQQAQAAGRLPQDVPVNHSAHFAPVLQPTLDTGTAALTVAALTWLGQPQVREALER